MKRIAYALPVIALLFLGACTLRMSATQTPTAIVLATEAPAGSEAAPLESAVAPIVSEVAPVETAVAPTVPAGAVQTEAVVAAAPTQIPPTAEAPANPYPSPTVEEGQPTATEASASQTAATATALPGTFDPFAAYGTPTYENPMEFPNYWEWAPPETDTLPNNSRIRLQFKDGQLYVTGKRPEFSTWWFSSHFLSDAYMQLTFNTEDCSGDDAYGMIFRGPQHLAGTSYGYVVYFTCDGRMAAFRLDDAEPWDIKEILGEEDFSAINSGAGEQNVLGIHAIGDTFTIYANGNKLATFQDDHFASGRFGVFVRAAKPDAYTYRVTNLAYWVLGEE